MQSKSVYWFLSDRHGTFTRVKNRNKSCIIKSEGRVVRIEDYLKNICMFRIYFLDTYGVDFPSINEYKMPQCKYEMAGQRTFPRNREQLSWRNSLCCQEEMWPALSEIEPNNKLNCTRSLCSNVCIYIFIYFNFGKSIKKLHYLNKKTNC